MSFRFHAEVWKYPGDSAWHFVTLPIEVAEEIHDLTAGSRRGFGSVRVVATIGKSQWSTSVFPEKKSGSYVLPLKKSIRSSEHLEDGGPADIAIALALVVS